jgi:hypothetical protein
MTIKIIQSTPDFLSLKEDWNNLLSSSASHVPFLRHEFLASWWSTLGGGEWDQGSLAILLDQDRVGSPTAIAPLFINQGRVMFLGSFEISDYLDFIAPPEILTSFIPAIFDYLQNGNFPAWEQVELYNLPENSPSLPILRDAANQAGLTIKEEVIQPAPYLSLPKSWQEYLEGLKDRYKKEIEKKLLSADQYFLPVSWYLVTDKNALNAEVDDFLQLMANHPQKKAFLTNPMIDQIKLSAREAFQEGWLQLAFLQVGDIKAAGYMNFDYDNQIWVYNSGINPLFENLSPGWVLLGKLIYWAIEKGRSGMDFMRGDEAYKYQFGGVEKKILRVEISK